MTVLFINNLGGGFCDHLTIEEGTTIAQLFRDKIPQGRPEDFLIRVNRLPVPQDQVLKDGDRITISPVKIEGA